MYSESHIVIPDDILIRDVRMVALDSGDDRRKACLQLVTQTV